MAKRNILLNVALWIISLLMLLTLVGYLVSFFIGLSYSLPPTVFWMNTWATVYYLGVGLFIANALSGGDKDATLFDIAIIATVVLFVGTILNVLFTIYSWTLWSGCIASAFSLDDAEELQCDNNNWMIYIQAIWSIVYAIIGGIGILAAAVDAVLHFSGGAVGRQAKSFGSKAKGAFGNFRSKITDEIPPGTQIITTYSNPPVPQLQYRGTRSGV